jgi:hypothetical protein
MDDGFECICQDQVRTGTFCEEKLDFCDSKFIPKTKIIYN